MFITETGGPEVLQYGELPTPVPEAQDILIEVAYAGINPADWKNRQGLLAPFRPYSFPYVIGFDAAGIVAAVGGEVTSFKPGDRVFTPTNHGQGGQGSYAQYTLAHQHRVAPVPDSLRLDQAAALPVAALTAWQALFDRGGLQPGSKVFVHGGSGGLGSFAVQFARWAGAGVAATCSTANVEYLRGLGVALAIDYQREDIASTLRAWAPDGVDLLVNAVGVSSLPGELDLIRRGGTLVSIPTLVDDGDMAAATAAAQAVQVKHLYSMMDDSQCAATLSRIAALVAQGDITLPPIREFPLTAAAEAHRVIQSGHNRGKLILKVADLE
ncbi:MAG: NADP-dependent oxidoreductase [Halioglobus sp.]|nr:NADP-dependent oxidoreductase [Halioglobus sp.]